MYKFLLAENPMKIGRVFILHTPDPKCLIEAITPNEQSDAISSGLPHKIFYYDNADGLRETWALVVRDIYSGTIDDVGELLKRAWKWYRSYLEYEDGNIDESERENYYGSVN